MIGLSGYFFRLGRGCKQDAKDFIAQRETVPQVRQTIAFHFKNDIHVKAGREFLVGDAGKVLFVHLLDRFNLAAAGADFGGDLVDDIFDAFFFGGRI